MSRSPCSRAPMIATSPTTSPYDIIKKTISCSLHTPFQKSSQLTLFFRAAWSISFTKILTLGSSTQSKNVILGKLTPVAEVATLVQVFYQVSPTLNKGAVFGGLVKVLFTLNIRKKLLFYYIYIYIIYTCIHTYIRNTYIRNVRTTKSPFFILRLLVEF